jgi:hypothetical protein
MPLHTALAAQVAASQELAEIANGTNRRRIN